MFIKFSKIKTLLSGSFLFSEAPVDESPAGTKTFGRQNTVWTDVELIRGVPLVQQNLANTDWNAITGKFVAEDLPASSFSNVPFLLETGDTYSIVLECIAGEDTVQHTMIVRSTAWEGERQFIRTEFGGTLIVDADWKETPSAYSDSALGTTNSVSFATILTHPLVDDTSEEITFFVYGNRTSGGFGKAFLRLEASVTNVAGVASIIGATLIYQHKSVGVISAQVLVDGAENCLLQVRGTADNWDWRVETLFNEVRV